MNSNIIYGDNIVRNGNAANGVSYWTTKNVTTSSSTGFRLISGASMEQKVSYVAANVHPSAVKIGLDYTYNNNDKGNLINETAGFMYVDLIYFGKDTERYTIALPSTATKTKLSKELLLPDDSILTGITVGVYYTNEAIGRLYVNNISVQSGIDGLASHELDDHPHELPFAISVNEQGIKATKGGRTMFWLKDTGDAIYNGELSASQITTGKLSADRIDTSSLVVGDNIELSDKARISWGNVSSKPTYLGNTYIDSTTIMAPDIEGGVIKGSVMIAGELHSGEINGGEIKGTTIIGTNIIGSEITSGSVINVETDVNVGENIYLDTSNFKQGIHFNHGFDDGKSSLTLADPLGGIHCNARFEAELGITTDLISYGGSELTLDSNGVECNNRIKSKEGFSTPGGLSSSYVFADNYYGTRAEIDQVKAEHVRATAAYDGKVTVSGRTFDIRGGIIYNVS